MIKTLNLVGSVLTAFGWFFAMIILSISPVDAVVLFSGLMMIGLWGVNLIGIIVGIISCVKETKSVVAWLGLTSHVSQIILTIGIMFIGMIS